jgi:dipeptidyl aminopeptidase/acylaminoacyl peptidase
MTRFDQILIQPTRAELGAAVLAAVRTANGRCRENLVAFSDRKLGRLLEDMEKSLEGSRHWVGGGKDARAARHASLLTVDWWTDPVGRHSHRVTGERLVMETPAAWRALGPRTMKRPPMWQIYPERAFLRTRARRQEWVVRCRCGACGTPPAVAWMGERCGPCHDLHEEGASARAPLDGPERTTLTGHVGPVFGLAFAPHGGTLATGSFDGTARLWDLATGRGRVTPRGRTRQIHAVAFSPDGRLLAAGSDDGTVRLWDAQTWEERASLRHDPAHGVSLAFSPDGRTLAVRHSGITLWHCSPDLRRGAAITDDLYRGRIGFAGAGALLAGNDVSGRTLTLWDAATGQPLGTLRGHGEVINQVAGSPDGKTLASASDDRTVILWDLAARERRAQLRGHSAGVWAVAFSPDGQTVASAGMDHTLRLWDAATGDEKAVLEWHPAPIFSVAFSPDGRWLATGAYDGVVKLWPWTCLLGP